LLGLLLDRVQPMLSQLVAALIVDEVARMGGRDV